MPRRNRRKVVAQQVKDGRTRTASFWHAIADGLDTCDEVLVARMYR